jgi:hypothetical protein
MNLQSHRKTVDDAERESRGIGGLLAAAALVLLLIALIAVVVTMAASSAHADEPSGDAATTTAKAGSNPAITSPEWHTVAESAAAAADVDSGGGSEPHGAIEDAGGDTWGSGSTSLNPAIEWPLVVVNGTMVQCSTEQVIANDNQQVVQLMLHNARLYCVSPAPQESSSGRLLVSYYIGLLVGVVLVATVRWFVDRK